MTTILESNRRDLEQFGNIRDNLTKYQVISRESREFSYSWNSSNKKKFAQTDISGDLKGVSSGKRENVNKIQTNLLSIPEMNEQYKRLQEDYKTFKVEVVSKENERTKLVAELKDEDKCPFCNRKGESLHIHHMENDEGNKDKKESFLRSMTVQFTPNKDTFKKQEKTDDVGMNVNNKNELKISKDDTIKEVIEIDIKHETKQVSKQ